MSWGQLPRRILDLMDLADRKGFEIERATIKDHWRLTGPDGKRVTNPTTKAAAFSVKAAKDFLEDHPDAKSESMLRTRSRSRTRQ